MQTEEIAGVVRELLLRTGIGRQLESEAEQARDATHAALRARKRASVARFLAERPKAEQSVRDAEAKQRAAQAAAEAALHEYVRARERLGAIIDSHSTELQELHPEMLRHSDPRIDAFRTELDHMLDHCESLFRTWVDVEGEPDSRRSRDNRTQVDQRIRAILAAQDELERLRVAHDVDDVGDAIRKLRRSIPEV